MIYGISWSLPIYPKNRGYHQRTWFKPYIPRLIGGVWGVLLSKWRSDLGECFPRLSSRKGSFVSSNYRRNKHILGDKTLLKHPWTSPKNFMHVWFLMWVTVDSKRFKVAIFTAYKKPTSHFKGPRLQGSKEIFSGFAPCTWMSQEVRKRLVYTWIKLQYIHFLTYLLTIY